MQFTNGRHEYQCRSQNKIVLMYTQENVEKISKILIAERMGDTLKGNEFAPLALGVAPIIIILDDLAFMLHKRSTLKGKNLLPWGANSFLTD